MQIDCLSGSPAAVWKVAGQLDTVTAPEFRIALDRIYCARLTELTLDFEELVLHLICRASGTADPEKADERKAFADPKRPQRGGRGV